MRLQQIYEINPRSCSPDQFPHNDIKGLFPENLIECALRILRDTEGNNVHTNECNTTAFFISHSK